MSKYRKLSTAASNRLDDEDEYPALFLDNNYTETLDTGNKILSDNNNSNRTNSSSSSRSWNSSHNNSTNHNSDSGTNSSNQNGRYPHTINRHQFINNTNNTSNNMINNTSNYNIRSSISNSNNSNNSNNNNSNNSDGNGNRNESDTATQTILDAEEENIMEVPLLHTDDDCNHDEYEPVLRQRLSGMPICRCNQPGFAANLKNKATQEAKCKILIAITLCCIFMIIEFLGGYIAGSLAIMTDAAHLASDCISFVIGLVAIWLGSRRPDGRMSFGYKRMEVMGAIVSILGIWILTAALLMMAVERIYSNDFDLDANTMMTISGIGILINIAMIFILHGSSLLPAGIGHNHSHAPAHAHAHSHSHSHSNSNSHSDSFDGDIFTQIAIPETDISLSHYENSANPPNSRLISNGNISKLRRKNSPSKSIMSDEKNLNLRAAMIHVIGDLVQSIGVFFAAVLIKIFPKAKFADPMCTILFSFIVIMTTARLFKESVTILLDAVPRDFAIDELEMDLQNIEGVKSVHYLNVWQHTSNFNVLMVHLVIDLLTDSNTVLDKATQLARCSKYNIKHSTIQIERLTS